MANSGNEIMQLEKQKVFKLGEITYLPHYSHKGLYVGPGRSSVSYTELQLTNNGAKASTEFLWERNNDTKRNLS
jgi:hypothetical protein